MVPKAHSSTILAGLALCTMLLTSVPARAQDGDELISLINAYRAAPRACGGRQMGPVGPLAPNPALSRVHIAPGTDLRDALKSAGYPSARAEAISVSGPLNASSAMAAIQQSYCRTLLSSQYAAVGVARNGDDWSIVLARPLVSPDLRNWQEAGKAILKLVNAARAKARTCGDRKFAAASPLAWNAVLGDAAFVHSRDMANQNYFSHEGKDGSQPGDRARRAGYKWRRIGENIATGQGSPQEVVAGWLSSPGHCVNIMNRDFTEMGAAYAVNSDSDTTIYWTQVFGTPR
jgi:uncharacterized protein YkwD